MSSSSQTAPAGPPAEPMTAEQLAAIEARAAAATAGPWGWRGHMSGSIELRALHSGGPRIITTLADRPCIDYHDGTYFLRVQDDFPDGDGPCKTCTAAYKSGDFLSGDRIECERSDTWSTVHVWNPDGFCEPINRHAKAEVLQWSDHVYRDDVKDTTHPDAEFIAHAREDVPALLAEVERLRAEHAEMQAHFDQAIKGFNASALEIEQLRASVAEAEKTRDGQVVSWLLKKAREYESRSGRDDRTAAGVARTLASKIQRGAVRPDNLLTLPPSGRPAPEWTGDPDEQPAGAEDGAR